MNGRRLPELSKAEREYVETHGHEALERQQALAATRCPNCWQPHGFDHHPLCPQHTDESEPAEQEEALF